MKHSFSRQPSSPACFSCWHENIFRYRREPPSNPLYLQLLPLKTTLSSCIMDGELNGLISNMVSFVSFFVHNFSLLFVPKLSEFKLQYIPVGSGNFPYGDVTCQFYGTLYVEKSACHFIGSVLVFSRLKCW